MKDPDKQEAGIFVLVLIAMSAGILVGFYLANTPMAQYKDTDLPRAHAALAAANDGGVP